MKRISIRNFQQKSTIYLSDLPITLTKYNKPVAVITPYSEKEPVSPNDPPGTEIPIGPKFDFKHITIGILLFVVFILLISTLYLLFI